jgi:hypothetical protein
MDIKHLIFLLAIFVETLKMEAKHPFEKPEEFCPSTQARGLKGRV